MATTDAPPSTRTARVPPHNLQAEESLLGAMLLSRDAIAAAVEVVSARRLLQARPRAHLRRDHVAVRRRRAGRPGHRRRGAAPRRAARRHRRHCGPRHAPGEHARHHQRGPLRPHRRGARAAAPAHRRRPARSPSSATASPTTCPRRSTRPSRMVFEVAQRRVTDTMAPIGDLLGANLDRLEKLYERGEAITGMPTGYIDLDEMLVRAADRARWWWSGAARHRENQSSRSAWPPTPRSRRNSRCCCSRSR